MEFWSRLIGGIGASPTAKPSTGNSPQQRLARFKKLHSESLRLNLQRLTAVLHEEARSPVPHPCLAFAASSQLHVTISQAASSSRNDGVIREAIAAFSTLIDSEEEEFLYDPTFAKSLMDFVGQVSGPNSVMFGPETEGEVVELLFGIAAKVRLQPDILPNWFTSQNVGGSGSGDEWTDRPSEDAGRRNVNSFEGVTHKEDFPLLYLLVGYMHHEGRVGDFSRTGMLYIIESASSSLELERWLVESDLATLMASGLGALYSQLSRKLVVSYADHELPTILALSDYTGPPPNAHAESSSSPDFQAHLDTFLSYLVFWQDVLEHCNSVEVKQTLLDHFQVLFLEQLLYPSLLESSDVDGGSAVAVLTYLGRILESLDHPDLVHLILHYLLALPDQRRPATRSTPTSPSADRKRKSLEMLTRTAGGEDHPTPDLFNLVDLVLASLRSASQQTVTATLKLLSVILRRHHRYAISTLLRTMPTPVTLPKQTMATHERHLEVIFSLVAEIGGEDDFDDSYDGHVKDNLTLLESHPCSAPLLAAKSGAVSLAKISNASFMVGGGPRDIYPHMLRTDDPLFKTILAVLTNFFTNSVDTNLSVTETIINLASCGYMRLEGWLLLDPLKQDVPPEADGEVAKDGTDGPRIVHVKQVSWSSGPRPPLLSALEALIRQLHAYRVEIPHFDEYVSERKQAFQVSDELNEALSSLPQSPRQPGDMSGGSPISPPTPSPGQRPTALDSISQRIFDIRTPDPISRASSPRGRQQAPTSHPKARLQVNSSHPLDSPTPVQSSDRAFSPSPLRGELRSASPPKPPTFSSHAQERLTRKIGVPREVKVPFALVASGDIPSSDASSVHSDANDREVVTGGEVTVSHLLTNVVILQAFLLELAALIQVRASLFGDVVME
ncbi:MAG: hypothetical protein M1838_005176 [Thelocarpon superellum]|nr:MAG: hypothetical protein M1838_005176 [Thelocarpon superellum]